MMFKPGLVFGLWLLAMLFAVANGTIGRLIVEPAFGEYPNHVYKSALGVAFVLFISWLYARTTRGRVALRSAWAAGLIWLALTIAFEFLAGHYLFGNPWERLFADYLFWEGRLWSLVLLAILFGPALMAWLLRRR